MARYHINPETGRPNICTATGKRGCKYAKNGVEPPHYANKEEARAGYETTMKNTVLPIAVKKNNSKQKKEQLLHNLRAAGIPATTYSNSALDLYHEGENIPTKVRSYKEPEDTGFTSSFLQKPNGVMWLSPGTPSSEGRIVTSWNEWTSSEEWNTPTNPVVHHAEIKPDAVMIELNEQSLSKVKKILHGEEILIEDETKETVEDYMSVLSSRLSGDDSNTVPWRELQEAGVDLVRVNGYRNRMVFYGWDCDSVVVLNGDVVDGWSSVAAERDKEKIKETFKECFNMDLEKK